ncbi:MAG: HDOD domain-containing protein [Polyangiaceae bacterium]
MGDLERPFPNANVLLDRVVDICPFPATAQRLMLLVNDERAPVDSIAAAVQCDPALATQVLRVANSAAFRPTGAEPVRDLRQALVSVGLEELRMMAGAMALMAAFATRDELSLDLHRTSAVSGAIAELIAPPSPGVARGLPHICGLLCEVGALACLAVDGPGYVEVWQRTVKNNGGRWAPETVTARDALEVRRYGITTRSVGARLLRRHQLPLEIGAAIDTPPLSSPDVPLLHRATAFVRIATPLVVDALRTKDSTSLSAQLAEVARMTAFVEVAADELMRRCLIAATNMEKTLRAARD